MDGKFLDAAEVPIMCVLRRIMKLALKSHSLDSKINSLAVTVYISDGFESFLRSTIRSENVPFLPSALSSKLVVFNLPLAFAFVQI